jgi:hypothetical protein
LPHGVHKGVIGIDAAFQRQVEGFLLSKPVAK